MALETPNHTQTVTGWAAHDSSGKIVPYIFKRRQNGVDDVTIQVMYCGICRGDLHQVKNDWGVAMYPVVPGSWFNIFEKSHDLMIYVWSNKHQGTMCKVVEVVDTISKIKSTYGLKRNWQGDPCAPRAYSWEGLNCSYDGYSPPTIISLHEITGVITKVGSNVKNFKLGDRVGVGCMAASCLECEFCKTSQENYCDQMQFTSNGIFWDGSITYGGYSDMLVADHRYVVRVPDNLPMAAAAPLLCAGITVFNPMKDCQLLLSPGKKVGIVGLGGLGHVAVKLAKAFGHHVTVISTSPSKENDAKERLSADDFIVSTDAEQMQKGKKTLDVILDTVSAKHSLGPILELLKVNGTLVVVGVPDKPFELPSFPLVFGKRSVKGSYTGSIKETQEMMDVCGKHNITCDIELIESDQINQAYDRLARNDVKYRFVIDIAGSSKR